MAHKPKKIGGNLNTSSESNEGAVSVGSTLAVTLVPEMSDRFYLEISNPNNQGVWIKYQEATIDNIKTGRYLGPLGRWVMPTADKYTGEVSVIMNSGGTKLIHFSEM